MWPFSKPKTVAETRKAKAAQASRIAAQISRLHDTIVRLEKQAPYMKNNQRRRKMELQKLALERRAEALETQYHRLGNEMKGLHGKSTKNRRLHRSNNHRRDN